MFIVECFLCAKSYSAQRLMESHQGDITSKRFLGIEDGPTVLRIEAHHPHPVPMALWLQTHTLEKMQ